MKDLSFVNTIIDTITDLATAYEVGAGKAPNVLYVGDLEMKALKHALTEITGREHASASCPAEVKKVLGDLDVIETTQFSFLKVGE